MYVIVLRHLNMDHQQDVNPTSLEKFARCGVVWKKHQSRSHRKTLWVVLFPNLKTVENEHVYIMIYLRKIRWPFFKFLDASSCTYAPQHGPPPYLFTFSCKVSTKKVPEASLASLGGSSPSSKSTACVVSGTQPDRCRKVICAIRF